MFVIKTEAKDKSEDKPEGIHLYCVEGLIINLSCFLKNNGSD